MNSSSDDGQTDKTDKRERLFAFAWTAAFLLCAIYFGYCFATTGFVSSDTLWLLALGRKIWQTNQIPQSDPLSFTLPLAAAVGMPSAFMPRQWLFEYSLYALFLVGKLSALIAVCSALVTFAFVVMPLKICARANTPGHYACTLVLLAALTAAVRSVVRPELITCAFMAIWLALLQYMRLAAERVNPYTGEGARLFGVDWKLVAACSVLQAFWSNIHSGFVLALAVLAVYAISFVWCDIVVNEGRFGCATKTALMALFISTSATLLNPVGTKLWTFMPTLLFSPIMKTIAEMRHVELADLGRAYFYPYFILVAFALVTTVSVIRGRTDTSLSWRSPLRLGSLFLILCACFEGLNCLRLMPVMSLILVCELATISSATIALASLSVSSSASSNWGALPSLLDWRSKVPKGIVSIFWCVGPPGLAAIAALFFANRFNPLVLPQASAGWSPPVQAINFLKDPKNQPSGPVFNEAKIGSMMTWYLPRIKVFFDTRFDQYGELLLADYDGILYAQPNCRDLLNTYGIDWVFVPKSSRIVETLNKSPGWETRYSDDEAIIFVRSK